MDSIELDSKRRRLNADDSVDLDDTNPTRIPLTPVRQEDKSRPDTPTMATPALQSKIFNDAIHGHIELHALIVAVIDTPQVQRLRRLKQLGCAHLVFPSASHSRFEHSIGVAYLAGLFAERIREGQPELGISDVDILCVQLAGLCHDLGHGPFSHQFEQLIRYTMPHSTWEHEDASLSMFDHLYKVNGLEEQFESAGLNVSGNKYNDLLFIKELIRGEPMHGQDQFHGRPRHMWFLYQIVANKINGIDVDKWDYFQRDSYQLGIKTSFDHNRLILHAKVLAPNHGDPDLKLICFRDKEVTTLYDMFGARDSLHRRAYQHKTVMIISLMINEILIAAHNHLKVPGENGIMKTLSEATTDMVAYTCLTDEILSWIEISQDPYLAPAKDLLRRVQCRQLYKYIGETQPKNKSTIIKENQLDQFRQEFLDLAKHDEISTEEFVFFRRHFSYGMKHEDPIQHARFFTKERRVVKMDREQVSSMLPGVYQESVVALCVKKNDLSKETKSRVTTQFRNWASSKNFVLPRGSDLVPTDTPLKQLNNGLDRSATPTNGSLNPQALKF